jgi:putative membrane protein
MKLGTILGGLCGLALAAWLLQTYGFGRIMDLLGHAGWFGLTAVIAFHLVQLLFSASAWWVIAGRTQPQPRPGTFLLLRWIRESVNNLLPVAQIGGEFVASRLLRRRGVPLAAAIAGSVADVTMEMLTQIAFTLLGLFLLLHSVGDGGIANTVTGGIVVALLLAGGFLGAQWFGLAIAIEKGLMRLGKAFGWSGTDEVKGLHAALIGCYRAPGRLALAAAWHSISWLLGGVEVCLALHVLGHGVGISAGLVIESLGQALKAVGFAIPGALGVQEGGYIVVCQLFGLSPEVAIALSLVKRLREVVLGVPGLIAWQGMEGKRASGGPQPLGELLR